MENDAGDFSLDLAAKTKTGRLAALGFRACRGPGLERGLAGREPKPRDHHAHELRR